MDCSSSRFVIHGLAVELTLSVPALEHTVGQMLKVFEDPIWPPRIVPVAGSVREYELGEIERRLSSRARRIDLPHQMVELYQDGGLFWVVDDRFGLIELNPLKSQFRAWILPDRRADDLTCVQNAILWPLAQMLRLRGLHLVPAVSVARDGWGVLLLTRCSLEQELAALVESGYQIIGQHWTALREESGQVSLLHLPIPLERSFRLRSSHDPNFPRDRWVDLNQQYATARGHHAFCETVLLVTSGRGRQARIKGLSLAQAGEALRADWPIFEPSPRKHTSGLIQSLLQSCRVGELRLSEDGRQTSRAIDALQPMVSILKRKWPRASVAAPVIRRPTDFIPAKTVLAS